MCGRFTLATPQDILAALFAVEGDEDWGGPRYNILRFRSINKHPLHNRHERSRKPIRLGMRQM